VFFFCPALRFTQESTVDRSPALSSFRGWSNNSAAWAALLNGSFLEPRSSWLNDNAGILARERIFIPVRSHPDPASLYDAYAFLVAELDAATALNASLLFHAHQPSSLQFRPLPAKLAPVTLPSGVYEDEQLANVHWRLSLPPLVQQLLSRVNVQQRDYTRLLNVSFANASVLALSPEDAACRWLRESTAWRAWLPPVTTAPTTATAAPVTTTTTTATTPPPSTTTMTTSGTDTTTAGTTSASEAPGSTATAPLSTSAGGGLLWWHILLIVLGAVLLLFFLVGGVVFWRLAKRLRSVSGSDGDGTHMGAVESGGSGGVGMSVVARSASEAKSLLNEDWRVRYSDLKIGDKIGSGGFGAVYRGEWRGTEVAVKKLFKSDMSEEFAQEVAFMVKLRHPNLVLFMGSTGSTSVLPDGQIEVEPPAIVMEYMPMGSLFDVLQNDDIALAWDAKVRFGVDIARGMTYLHECKPTLLHGDLKSLNVLVDKALNAKVSDFGLTRFKSSDGTNNVGSLFWAAPEVIKGEPYTSKSDVYSFGIVLYEIVTRKQPYIDLDVDPLAVASAVVLGRARPAVPQWCPSVVESLMTTCWDQVPATRPEFRAILERLQRIENDKTLSGAAGADNDERNADGSAHAVVSPPPPRTEVAIVTCDVALTADRWLEAPTVMRDALIRHNKEVRRLLVKHGGYEVRSESDGTVITAVFAELVKACEFCLVAQVELLDVQWPPAVLKLADCDTVLASLNSSDNVAEDDDDADNAAATGAAAADDDDADGDADADADADKKKGRKSKKRSTLNKAPAAAQQPAQNGDSTVTFRGPRARASVHVGVPEHSRDELTGRVDFMGQVVEHTHKIRLHGHGGQVVISQAVFERIETQLGSLCTTQPDPICRKLSKAQSRGLSPGEVLRYLLPRALTSRLFPKGRAAQLAVPDYMVNHENVDFDEQAGALGTGSFGEVYAGEYADAPVAVKKLFQQRPKEAVLLDFRAELARMSTLNHENLALFVGGSTVPGRLLIVHELMPTTLARLIANLELEFAWSNKLKVALGIAEGVGYLHSLALVHRNLRLSNVLLDDDLTPRLVDFGFEKVKATNHTMSKSALPGWAPPEVLAGLPYGLTADVFNCGMLFWQIVTRDANALANASLNDVISGESTAHLAIPEDTPQPFVALLKKCWNRNVEKRPTAAVLAKKLKSFRKALEEDSDS
jgi:serine/threonine protein kinase